LSPGSGIIGDFFAFHFAESNQAIAGRITVEGKDIYVVNAHLHAGLPDDERWGREMELHRQASTMTEKEYAALVERWRGSIDRRQSETQGLLAWMRAKLPPEAPVVLMGDFNAQPQSEEITWVLVDDFIDTWAQLHGTDEPGSTWEPESNLNIQTYYDVPDPYDSAYTVWEKLKALNRQVSRRIDYIFVKKVPAKYILRSEVVFDQVTKGQHPSDHFGVLATIRLNSKQ
ncbi:MAG: endonuclease/exonuclease/phosphatase family protein, partial [Candidatus Neomarinimicrobiota bacterium]